VTRAQKLLCVGLLSLLAHAPGISNPLTDYHHHRQVNTAAIARNYHYDGLPFFHPRINWEGPSGARAATELPMYMYIVGAAWDIFDLGEQWGRLVSIFFSLLTALLLFWFLERWLSERAAFSGALLFSLLPVEVFFGRTVQPEALALCATLGSFCCLDLYLSGKRRILSWLAAALLAAIAIGHKIPYGYMLGVCGMMMLARKGKKAFTDPALWFFIPTALGGVAAWYMYARSGTYVVPTQAGAFLALLDYSKAPYYIQFQFLSRLPELAVSWPGMGLWAVGLWNLQDQKKDTRLFLWGWLGCVAIYVTLGGAYTHHHDYTALPWALVNAAIMGLGLDRALSWSAGLKGAKKTRARWALAALVLAIPAYTFIRISHWYKTQDDWLPRAGEVVAQMSKPTDLFLCNERAPSFFLYYINRDGWSEAIFEMQYPTLEWVEKYIAQGGRYYLTRALGEFKNPNDPRVKPLLDRFPIVHKDPKFLILDLQPKT
jgi:4-amino-4-deoxy-L-arabinose transferase-like glycosyltransferase